MQQLAISSWQLAFRYRLQLGRTWLVIYKMDTRHAASFFNFGDLLAILAISSDPRLSA
jgi:hypothetical protein